MAKAKLPFIMLAADDLTAEENTAMTAAFKFHGLLLSNTSSTVFSRPMRDYVFELQQSLSIGKRYELFATVQIIRTTCNTSVEAHRDENKY